MVTENNTASGVQAKKQDSTMEVLIRIGRLLNPKR